MCGSKELDLFIFIPMSSQMVSWPLVHWLLVIFHVRAHLHTGETKVGQFCHQISCVFKCTPLYSVSCLLCNFWTQRVQTEIQIMALFSNQKYESEPEALIPTYSQTILIKLSVGLSKSLWSVRGVTIAFQAYLLLEDMGGPEKDWVLLQCCGNLF